MRNGGWSSEQLIGRISLYKRLPESLAESDLEAVAQHWLPDGEERAIRLLVTYAQSTEKYLQGIESLALRARFLARKADREHPSFADVATALKEGVVPSDNALAAALSGAQKPRSLRAIAKPYSAPVQAPCIDRAGSVNAVRNTTFTPPVRDTGDSVPST